jgi:hypothetical protein
MTLEKDGIFYGNDKILFELDGKIITANIKKPETRDPESTDYVTIYSFAMDEYGQFLPDGGDADLYFNGKKVPKKDLDKVPGLIVYGEGGDADFIDGGTMFVGVAYGNGPNGAMGKFVNVSEEGCSAEFLAPTFNLNIPCPISKQRLEFVGGGDLVFYEEDIGSSSGSSGDGSFSSSFGWDEMVCRRRIRIGFPGSAFVAVRDSGSSVSDPAVVKGFRYCYWMNGGVTMLMGDSGSSGFVELPGTDGFIALRAGTTASTEGEASLACFGNLAALQNAQRDVSRYTVPLYIVKSSKIAVDLRNMPQVVAAEII